MSEKFESVNPLGVQKSVNVEKPTDLIWVTNIEWYLISYGSSDYNFTRRSKKC